MLARAPGMLSGGLEKYGGEGERGKRDETGESGASCSVLYRLVEKDREKEWEGLPMKVFNGTFTIFGLLLLFKGGPSYVTINTILLLSLISFAFQTLVDDLTADNPLLANTTNHATNHATTLFSTVSTTVCETLDTFTDYPLVSLVSTSLCAAIGRDAEVLHESL